LRRRTRHLGFEVTDLFLETVDPSGLLSEAGLKNIEHERREADREKESHRVGLTLDLT
jgi:hypothetical protein